MSITKETKNIKEEKSMLQSFLDSILNLIFPERHICFLCDKYDEEIDEKHICDECMTKIKYINSYKCSICGKPLVEQSEINIDKCLDCRLHPHYFKKVVAPLEYEGVIKDAIYKYKYGQKPYMYKMFGPILLEAIYENDIEDVDIVVPVPLHKSKYAKRGFNQAELLSKYISKSLNIRLSINNLIRIKNTVTQNKLHRLERRKNIEDAFKVIKREEFVGKKVLLVDDIFTTGSTVDECSRMLLESGAKEVIVLAIATGKNS